MTTILDINFDGKSDSLFEKLIFLSQRSLNAMNAISATAHKNGSRNTERPNRIISPDIISDASPSTRMILLASTGEILSSLTTSLAYMVEFPDSVWGSSFTLHSLQSPFRSAAPFHTPPPTLTSTIPIPGATPEAVPDTYDWFPISCSVSRFILTFSVLSMLPAASTKANGSACPYPNSLSGRVSRILQSLNPGSSRSCKSLSIE